MATKHVFSGANLRARRKTAGYTQDSLGQKLGTRRTNVNRWENNQRSPQPPVLLQLAEVLDCQVGDLFEAVAE
ncbi:helix-turn-helix domain-containing protein [Micromonospora sp. LH3U1]|uniref:helix-turn-helix domain-containing protein n=1 Tax=Micromonospora sp. LH3U1 TaxID=3018339 RepID=UPI00234BF49F|nr:helix-turn-helix transcriptional regulator [Micromonospora sp. LH3U1]WCN80032.1 helix-turn-helix transcriptional regulator [Micromonospora sp. LH3U1]